MLKEKLNIENKTKDFSFPRHNYLDFIKGLAIFLVIETHAREMAGTNFYGFILKALFYSFDRNGVILFFLCSGSLLLSKESIKLSSLMGKAFRLIALLSFYSIITNIIYYTLNGKFFLTEIKDAFLYNNMITSHNYDKAIHLWFLCSYIPLLLASPFISAAVRSISDKTLYVLLGMLTFFGPIAKILVALGLSGFIIFDAGENATFLLYMIIGYSLHSGRINADKLKPKHLAFILALSCASSVFVQYLMFTFEFINENSWRIFNNYSSSIFLLPSSICIFLLIKNAKISSFLIEKIGKCSFGIYLVHYSIMLFLYSLMPTLESLPSKYIEAMMISLITLPLSIAASGLIKRIGLSYLVR